MFELSFTGEWVVPGVPPGALPFVAAACFAVAVAPVPLILREAGKGGEGESQRSSAE
eukprot:CAMPEP_0171980108 /NCGR_PEP_ID=MMETSP0993-20121228/259852_1 /TAXON_ID=483369 /ORGANISM="non described non described, Strain CCMP2098" /LENGTH=56 /DNA_ID=CAMNT_0012632289 /DNA_START=31 /DNA_END=201 /DNA_ORIENTATION=-